MSVLHKFTPALATEFFEIHLLADQHYHVFDLGKSTRSQSFGVPQYTQDRHATLEEAEARAREYATDRGDL